MIQETLYRTNIALIDQALSTLNDSDAKIVLNYPTGDFFYDPWTIKKEYEGTVWEELLYSLGDLHGEARIITMSSKQNYVGHCDIDDRWHLNISGKDCYLIDLDTNTMHKCIKDGRWYLMNTGVKHTAANFGNSFRHQLVVRRLLQNATLSEFDSSRVTFFPKIKNLDEVRYEFDSKISPLLNWANKNNHISNFKLVDQMPTLIARNSLVEILKEHLGNYIGMEVK